MQSRLDEIKKDVADIKKRHLRLVQVQQPGFNHLEVYSVNQKVNSIVRTLCALNGKQMLMRAAMDFLMTKEGMELENTEAWELYQAVKWAAQWEVDSES